MVGTNMYDYLCTKLARTENLRIALAIFHLPLSLLFFSLSLSLSCFPEEFQPWYCGISIPDRDPSYPAFLLFLSLPTTSCFCEGLRPWYCGISIPDRNPSYHFTLLFLSLYPTLSCFCEGLRPWYCGISIPDRNPSYPFTLRFLSLPTLSCFCEGLRHWYCGISIPNRDPSYPAFLLFLTLSPSGKSPCIRHTKVRWEVGSRCINPIQPYSFSRQLHLCYQDRLCTIIQLEYKIVRVVNWFPCWGPVWSRGWDINATLLFFYSTAPRTSCLGSPVTRYQSGTEDACCRSGTAVARYHRPFEARSANSTRRETFQQLAACSSSPHAGWFAPLSVPPGSPAALAPVSEPLGGAKPRETRKPRHMRH